MKKMNKFERRSRGVEEKLISLRAILVKHIVMDGLSLRFTVRYQRKKGGCFIKMIPSKKKGKERIFSFYSSPAISKKNWKNRGRK